MTDAGRRENPHYILECSDVGESEAAGVDAVQSIFLSYAHEDRPWVDELRKYLTPSIRQRRLRLWDDQEIPPGGDWQAAINDALARSTVSIPFVTQDFLASAFINDVELPAMLERASRKETRVMWIAVRSSTVATSPLAPFQAVNDPDRPLAALSKPELDAAFVAIATAIDVADTLGSLANSLAIVDETYETLEAAVQGRPEDVNRQHRVVATYEPQQAHIAFSGSVQTVSHSDLANLGEDDRKYIRDLEDTLRVAYERYIDVKKLIAAGSVVDDDAESALKSAAKPMCSDLNQILGFLRDAHKVELEDHYNSYRYICGQL